MKRYLSLLLFALMLMTCLPAGVFAADGDPLDENGDTGGTGPGGDGGLGDYWTSAWYGMRITVIDITDPAREIDGEQWGKVAQGTVSVDITNLSASDSFFTRTLAGDGSTPLAHGSSVTHCGKVSKMEYRDGAALATTNGSYGFKTVTGLPQLMGDNRASAQTIKDYINNEGMLTNIASWCGISSYEELIGGKYKLLCEPVLYSLAGTIKYAFTATEGALLKPHGNQTGWPLINNTLANAFFLEYDELGWDAWGGSTNVNQPFQTIIDSLGMHIYSIVPDGVITQPKSVKITKKSDTGASLSGAQFSVAGNGKNETVTVNGSLSIDLTDWANGTYTVTETGAPSGYTPSAAPQTFTIGDSGVIPAELTFINTFIPPPPVKVEFKKVEYGTNIGLGGAIFKVTQLSHWEKRLIDPDENDDGEFYDDDNGDELNAGEPGYHHNVEDLADDVWEWIEVHNWEVVGTFVSENDGSIPVGALEAGSYAIEEIVPPAGYALSESPLQYFDIPREGGYEVSIVFANKKLPGLTVLKVDEETGAPLAGAEFSIRHNGNIVYEGVTDSSGMINLPGLEPGWYEAAELAAPFGYLKRDESKSVYLDNGGSAQLKFDNRKRPTLEIEKVDAQGGAPLAGAKFRVTKADGATIGEYVTDASGKVSIPNLDEAVYSIEEILAPSGYLLDPQHKDILLEWGKVKTVVFTDHKKPGLTITKTDEATGARLADAHFRVESLDGSGFYYEGATDGNGQIHLDNLAEGVYEITETAAPDGYIIANHPKQVELLADTTVNVIFTNRAKPVLRIVKLDENTKQPLAGAKFTVQKTESATVSEYVTGADGTVTIPNLDETVYSVTEIVPPAGYVLDDDPHTDIRLEWGKTSTIVFENKPKPGLLITKVDADTGLPVGVATFRVAKVGGFDFQEVTTDESGSVFMENLEPGTYEVSEITAPDGYLKDAPTQTIILIAGENTAVLMPDHKKPTLTVIKRDELTGLPLAGATFKLWKTEGETWAETQVTGANGTYTWTGLDEGIYSIQEIEEPYGYFKDAARKEILLMGGDNKQLEFFNRPRPVLTIFKRDAVTGEPIADTKFKVQKTEGATIGEFLTGENGMIELSPATGYLLEEAVYTVTEIAPPNEYMLSENNSKQILLKWYEPTELIFNNLLKPTLIFIKTNGLTGRGIDDATYRVEFESPNGGIVSLGEYKTKCGLIVLPHVLPGWYVLTETKAAPGYSLPTNPTQRLHLAPGENSYTYDETREDLYADPRTNPNNGSRGMCGEWCGYLCSTLCAGNCGNPGGGNMSTPGGGLSAGQAGTFANMTITNGNGESLGGSSGGNTQTDTTKPVLSAGSAVRSGSMTATVTFTSSEAGRYYFSAVVKGSAAPTVSTLGNGTACAAGVNTVTVYLTAGEKDLYIKVKDAAGNVSDVLKIDVPAYQAEASQTTDNEPSGETETPTEPPTSSGGVIYLNPDFKITVSFGNP
jgi:uncharacterized surface anchored protein